jgi:hypothetical protein
MNQELLECECRSTERAQKMGEEVKILIEAILDYGKLIYVCQVSKK